MIIPQHTQYKINTGYQLDQDELDYLVYFINNIEDPATLMFTINKLMTINGRTLIKIWPKVYSTCTDLTSAKNKFSFVSMSDLEEIKQFHLASR